MISEVYNIDCLEYMKGLPDKFFDLAIVDHPYGIGLGFSNGHKNKNGIKGAGHEQKKWNNITPTTEYFNQLYRVSTNYIIWGCNYYGCNIKDVGRIIHYKKPSPFIASTYSHADIAATNMQKRITLFEYQWSGNVQNGFMNCKNIDDTNRGIERRIHPTQKPIALYRWLLQKYAKQGDKIFDSHMGSQSSRIAAHIEGFDYWGCELDEQYFNDGNKRFELHKQQAQLFS